MHLKYRRASVLLPAVLVLFLFAVICGAFPAPSGGLVLVANKGDRTLGLIDPVAGRQIAVIAEEGVTGHEVAASPDGHYAYVPIFGNAGVGRSGTDGRLLRVIDLKARRISGTVDFGRGVRPHCAVVGPKDGLLYITTELDNAVTVVDPKTLKILRTIPTGQAESHMLAITRDGRRGYTANVGPGTVSVLDLEAGRVLTTIAVAPKVQRISLSEDDRWVFTADQTRPRLAVIDTEHNEVAHWVDLPGVGYGTAPVPGRKLLLVALLKVNRVGAVDLEIMRLVRTLEVPRAPQEILVRPDASEAYVSCDSSAKVVAVDLRKWIVRTEIEAGAGADGLAWAPR